MYRYSKRKVNKNGYVIWSHRVPGCKCTLTTGADLNVIRNPCPNHTHNTDNHTSPVVIMLIDKALSSDKPNGHWFEADWLHCKRDALSSNRKVDGSRLTGSTQACHS